MTQQLRYDLLGAIKYKNKALNGVKPNSAVAVLDRYFDLSAKAHNQLYRAILSSKKNLTLVVHGSWAGSSHTYNTQHLERALRLAKRLHKIGVSLNCLDRIYLSPFLEQRNGAQFINSSFKQLHYKYPDIKLVNSYIPGGHIPAQFAEYVEIHGDTAIPGHTYLWSYDGIDYRRTSVQAYKRKQLVADQFAMWIPECNGKDPKKGLDGSEDTTPPLKRTFWPTLKQIKEMGDAYNG